MAHRAREHLVRLAKKHQLILRQSYERISKRAFIAHQRYAHAKQFNRAKKELRRLRTYLGRLERDIVRKIKGNEQLIDIFRRPLYLAERVRLQRPRGPGEKIYSLHAPAVECIGKDNTHKLYEFGVKASIAGTLHPQKADSLSLMSRRSRKTYYGNTLVRVIPAPDK